MSSLFGDGVCNKATAFFSLSQYLHTLLPQTEKHVYFCRKKLCLILVGELGCSISVKTDLYTQCIMDNMYSLLDIHD